uniref:Bravo_FIGEY domain-containing protein n=2 Tax=Hymenolepis diminuta TaxID=6216 RepID=A0A0R3SU01_HYMDI
LTIVHFWRVEIARCKMRLLCVFIVIFLLTFTNHFLAKAQDELLEFIPVEGANTKENIYLTDSSPEVLIDATSKVTRSIYFLGSTNLVTHIVLFTCQVATRSKPLTDVKLCCGGGRNNLVCHRLSSQSTVGKISCNQMQFDYVFDSYTGANFSLNFEPIREHPLPYNEQIYCEVEDDEATIQSNIVDLRDAIFYKTQLNVTSSKEVLRAYQHDIPPQDFPLKFSCGAYADKIRNWPSWMAAVWQQYLSSFEWAFCRVGSNGITAAGCAKNKESLGLGDSVTTMDGTLFLLSDTVLAKNPNSAFVCLVRGSTASPIRAYGSDYLQQLNPLITKGFTLNPNAPSSQVQGFTNLSPLETSYQFTEGTALSDFKLLAFYRVPESARPNFRYGWYKDGKKLTDPEATPTSFRLPNKVERSFSGIYELLIMEGGSTRLKFIFNVSVVGAPTFKDVNCIEDLFYALEGSSKRYMCLLNVGENEQVSFKVGINGFEADSGDTLRKILASSLQLQNQPIENLDIDFWRYDSRDSKGVAVEVKNLVVGQNFRLSIKAINAYGQSLVAGTLRVVPKPSLQVAPSRLSCTTECNEDPFDLQCIPTSAVSNQWNSLGIIFQQGWVLARTFTMEMVMEDPDLAKFFEYNSSTPNSLKVSPYIPVADLVKITDLPTTVTTTQTSTSTSGTTNLYTSTSPPKENLQEMLTARLSRAINTLQLECRFQLFVNNSRAKFIPYSMESVIGGASRKRRETSLDEQKKIYDSYNEDDQTLKETFTVSRTFSEVAKPAGANFAWVAAVVIAIIFILIVVIVGVWLCTRNRGETYKLSKKEYKLGNDPIRELKEKETFQTYERPEEPPSLASGIEEHDLEVGSDDDGELEAYNMDPARSRLIESPRTFNEEASFIGQYSSPSRTSGYREHHTAV